MYSKKYTLLWQIKLSGAVWEYVCVCGGGGERVVQVEWHSRWCWCWVLWLHVGGCSWACFFKIHSKFSPLAFLFSYLLVCILSNLLAVCWWRSCLRHCATSRKVAGLIPDGVNGIFHWHNPSGRSMALGLTQPLTEMSARCISWGVKAVGT
jgi:hypothetical protein